MVAFGVLWMCVAAAASVVVLLSSSIEIGPTEYCMVSSIQPYTVASSLTILLYDTAFFVLVAYRLVCTSHCSSPYIRKGGWVSSLRGDHLPDVSRTLLRKSYWYYR